MGDQFGYTASRVRTPMLIGWCFPIQMLPSPTQRQLEAAPPNCFWAIPGILDMVIRRQLQVKLDPGGRGNPFQVLGKALEGSHNLAQLSLTLDVIFPGRVSCANQQGRGTIVKNKNKNWEPFSLRKRGTFILRNEQKRPGDVPSQCVATPQK